MDGHRFVDLELDAKITEVKSDAIQFALAGNETATVRQWASGLAVGGAGPVISGSPESVANQLNDWFITSGLDGFNLAYTVMPECVDDFVDLVIPQLQKMGVFKTRYRQGSFREKLFGRSARIPRPMWAQPIRAERGRRSGCLNAAVAKQGVLK